MRLYPAQPSGVLLCPVSLLFDNIICPCFQFLFEGNTNLLEFVVGQLAFVFEHFQTTAYKLSVLLVQFFQVLGMKISKDLDRRRS